MPDSGITTYSIHKQRLIKRKEYIDCHCGNAIFIDGSSNSSIGVINFYNKTAKCESNIGFILDFGNLGGWLCLHCGSRHPKSETISDLFENWLREDIHT